MKQYDWLVGMTIKKYKIKFNRKYLKNIEKVPKKSRHQIVESIRNLAIDPRPNGCKKLKGSKDPLYRIRCGDYRVVYTIRDDILVVLIIEVGPRSSIYRQTI